MMRLKNISKRRIRIGQNTYIEANEEVDGSTYLLNKHSELVDITPKPVRKKQTEVKKKVEPKIEFDEKDEVNKYDIE